MQAAPEDQFEAASLNKKVSIIKRRERLGTVATEYVDMLSSKELKSWLQLQNEVPMQEDELLYNLKNG